MTLGVESPYIPRDDESEASRVADINGVGDPVYLDPADIGQYSMRDFGMGLDEDSFK